MNVSNFTKMTDNTMRKLKLQVQMTVDGFVAGPNGEMDWMIENDGDPAIEAYVNALTDTSDTILLGRNMTEEFVHYWTDVVNNKPESPEFSFAQKMVNTPKVVFTKTMAASPWANTVLAKGDLTQEITRLKAQAGKDILVYGGAAFVSSLIKADLIDEFHLCINPVVIGSGMSIFTKLTDKQTLILVEATSFDCGTVVLHYKPRRAK